MKQNFIAAFLIAGWVITASPGLRAGTTTDTKDSITPEVAPPLRKAFPSPRNSSCKAAMPAR